MKKSEYLEQSYAWRQRWNAIFDRGLPPVGTDPEFHWDCVITCYTEGCPNYNRYWRDSVQENLDGVYRLLCGECGNAIEDLDPLLEDDEEFRLNCRLSDGSLWTEELC